MQALDSQTVTNTVLPALVNGETGKSIAAQVGCHESTISRWKDRLSTQLETLQTQLLDQSGEAAIQNITTTIGRANSVLHNPEISHSQLSDYKDLLQLSHKKEVLVAQSMGILPSHSRSIVINNWSVGQVNAVIDPGVQAVLGNQLDGLLSDTETIEAEYTEVSSNSEGGE